MAPLTLPDLLGPHNPQARPQSANAGMARTVVIRGTAPTATFVSAANPVIIPGETARSRARTETPELPSPRWAQGFLWSSSDHSSTPSASATETAPPLPDVPAAAWNNKEAVRTISEHPDLLRIVSPINVDRFEQLLESHPNRALVASVCKGLREGFWPFADADASAPTMWDYSAWKVSDEQLAFLARQRDIEVEAGHFSSSFGRDLLPGMYSIPISAVPKPGSTDLRMVTDHSAGPHAPNSWISKDDTHVRLDNLQDLGKHLIALRREFGDAAPLTLWKSDISLAYRHLPMHPLWQLKQIVTIDGLRYVDRCMVFGCRASAILWCTVYSLILWIAIYVKLIRHLLAYMDDNFTAELAGSLRWYAKYGRLMPAGQATLLELWDELNISHRDSKQLHGPRLTIIGFEVGTLAFAFTLPADRKLALLDAISQFLSSPDCRRSLREWQQMVGWCNWALNVAPRLRPALQSSYAKLSRGSKPHARIFINKAVCRDLTWFSNILRDFDGRLFLKSSLWPVDEADLIIFCDASLSGLGFWCPTQLLGFYYTLSSTVQRSIFFFESLCVLSALAWAAELPLGPSRVVIYTDSLNSVQIFGSLAAQDGYNDILMHAVTILLDSRIDLRVLHVAGQLNTIADMLSRGMIQAACTAVPSLRINSFSPPLDLLGAVER